MPSWNAQQYLKFEKERTQPAIDLAARIPLRAPAAVIDMGCGPGNSTRVLAEAFPAAQVEGLDASPEMVAAARQALPQLTFQCRDAASGLDGLEGRFDVVFSNACIQWIPDHPRLLHNWLALLRPGGALAVQTPMNTLEPIHQIIEQLVQSERWQGYFEASRVFHNLSPEAYFDLLSAEGTRFEMWETVYHHILVGAEAIMEWYRGTGLRPYLQALPQSERPAFEAEVLRAVRAAYPPQRDGRVIFRFPRFFFVAVKR